MIVGFSHYNLRGPRALMEQLRTFYTEVVGLQAGERPPFPSFGHWLYAGGRDVLHLSEARPGEERAIGVAGTFDHVAFECTGRADTERRLTSLGVSYRVARVPLTGQVQLFFTDPAGNGVELNFPASEATSSLKD
jgi:catechol-2,3-dioxygenase